MEQLTTALRSRWALEPGGSSSGNFMAQDGLLDAGDGLLAGHQLRVGDACGGDLDAESAPAADAGGTGEAPGAEVLGIGGARGQIGFGAGGLEARDAVVNVTANVGRVVGSEGLIGEGVVGEGLVVLAEGFVDLAEVVGGLGDEGSAPGSVDERFGVGGLCLRGRGSSRGCPRRRPSAGHRRRCGCWLPGRRWLCSSLREQRCCGGKRLRQ